MLKGKVCVITGRTRGIGYRIAEKMAENGADIAIIGRNFNEGFVDNFKKGVGRDVMIQTYRCDVSNFEEVKQTMDEIIKDFGHIDVLVNNAGIVKDKLILSMKEEDFDDVLNVNLKGAFNTIRHTFSHFAKRRTGSIINISSVSGLLGTAGQANYASSKAGLIGLTKTVARELAQRGVTCNAIAPGFIETDMTNNLSDKLKETYIEQIPMKKFGKTDDIANLAVFLASDSARYITGEVIRVDGGLCM
ncbi:MAG: 3-oxoacyl-[acyl-carrier-protein] reductase [Clostridiaceae bacterium]|nr:3-oxoacyl-[acyl-carrier-protein] reductase [Clostridiaceae bacterium]